MSRAVHERVVTENVLLRAGFASRILRAFLQLDLAVTRALLIEGSAEYA